MRTQTTKPAKKSRHSFAPVLNPKSPYQQQGDCLLKQCGTKGVFKIEHAKIPNDAKAEKTNLVLKGQNNNHALYDGKFEVLKKDNTVFVRVEETCVLDHVKDLQTMARAEHHAQEVLPGEYFLDTVMEMDHVKEESRPIQD